MSAPDPTLTPVVDAPLPVPVSRASGRPSRRAQIEEAVLPPLVALLLAAVVGDVLILTFGQSPGAVYRLLLDGTWAAAHKMFRRSPYLDRFPVLSFEPAPVSRSLLRPTQVIEKAVELSLHLERV